MPVVLPKIVVVLGPTASGKTDLGLRLAREYNGEVISADSRQIYQGMNIGTAKPAGEWHTLPDGHKVYLVEGVPHYLMDIVTPDTEFTLADFKDQAMAIIADVNGRGKLPIIVGGTGLYIWSLVDNLAIPPALATSELRRELAALPLAVLVNRLKTTDPESASVVDLKNPRRVARALEVALTTGTSFVSQRRKEEPLYNVLELGLNPPRSELYSHIDRRVDEQMQAGLLEETRQLAARYDWELPAMTGIGYRQMGYFLRGEKTLPEAVDLLKRDTRHYAKRQISWFKRDLRIQWLDDLSSVPRLMENFIARS